MTAYDHKVSYGLPSSVLPAKRGGTSSDSGDVNERGEPSQQGRHVFKRHHIIKFGLHYLLFVHVFVHVIIILCCGIMILRMVHINVLL